MGLILAPPKRTVVKPRPWNFHPSLVEPRWQNFWRTYDIRLASVMWEGGGLTVRDLSPYSNHGTLGGSATWQPGRYGVAVDFANRSTHARIDHGSDGSLDDLFPLTVVVLTRCDGVSSADDDQRTVAKGSGVDTGNGWFILPLNGSVMGSSFSNAWGVASGSGLLTSNEWAVAAPDGSLSLGSYRVVAFELTADVGETVDGSTLSMWVDGAPITETVVRSASRTSDATSALYQGDDSGSTAADEPYEGETSALYVIQGSLPDAVHAAIAADPFGPFRPMERLWIAPGGSGGTTFTETMLGSLSPTGTLTRQTQATYSGTATSSGTLTRQTQKTVSGTLSMSGTLDAIKTILRTFAGTMTSAGSLVRQTAKTVAGSLTSSGDLTKQTTKTMEGTLTSSGTLSAIRTVLLSVAGTMATSGALTLQAAKTLTGNLATSGTVTRRTSKTMTGTLSMSGGLTKQISKLLVGAMALAGTLATSVVVAGAAKGGQFARVRHLNEIARVRHLNDHTEI